MASSGITPAFTISLPIRTSVPVIVPRRARTHRAPRATTTPRPEPVRHVAAPSPSSSSASASAQQPLRATSADSKLEYIAALRATLESRCVQAKDTFWAAMQAEARQAAADEPLLASFLFASVLNHPTLHSALAFHLANKLASPAMPSTMLVRLFQSTMDADPEFCPRVRRDLLAVMERDPACTRFIDALLYYKGFHALQAHRVAHLLWLQRRAPLAYHLHSQVAKELQVDIHPAAVLGAGLFVDHATGIVVGETAVIGDDCSILHHVTLGGSGKKHGDRHPKLGNGVLVGAGATILGNVSIGDGVQIGACSLVLEDVAASATVVGVPARAVGKQKVVAVPALDMKHERCLADCTDVSHGHSIDPNRLAQPSPPEASVVDSTHTTHSSSSFIPSPSPPPPVPPVEDCGGGDYVF